MADTDRLEQQFLDGTHPALHRQGASSPSAATTLHLTDSPPTDTSDHHQDEDGDDDSRPIPLREATNAPPPPPPRRRGEESRNTGVKGVRADYAEAMLQQQQQHEQDLARRVERGLNLVGGERVSARDDDERAELVRWRQRRLAQLQGSGERQARATRTFGHLSEVGIETFVAAVEDEDPETAVVVHLYEPDISTCATLNSHLASLARAHPRTKFLRAQASEVGFMQQQQQPTVASFASDAEEKNAGDATLPTVLVYRAGGLETVWVRFDFECPGGKVERGPKGLAAVEQVLSSAGVIVRASSARNGSDPRRTAADDSDDD
ncbi:hypothetical protein BMF94_1326 [Rhodotorula taiwanensis]|uniref:Phosducin domain-containing protein n=1 Tax=Rhodotorula taiwanensis TaxID=741276 RepID=A0A2S5BG28_9BASI|nr:hypothetical protein BMF94_1326 [Rhodotorula taiwanensis]